MFSGTHSGPGALNEQGRRKQAPGGPLGPPPPRAKAQSRDIAFGRGKGTRALYDVIAAHAAILMKALVSSQVDGVSKVPVRSTTDTSGVGTRKAVPTYAGLSLAILMQALITSQVVGSPRCA